MYMKCWPLPSFRDYGHGGVLFTYTNSSSSSWKCQKHAAEQLLGTAGGTVRYHRRSHGLPITVKIIAPLLQPGRAGRHDGSILYDIRPRQKEGDGLTEEMNWEKTFLAVKTFERIVA
jgi:hypothetical protein